MYFEDKKDVDYKFIGVSPTGTFKNIESIDDLLYERPTVLEILKLWFLSYKKPGKMVFFRFLNKDDAVSVLQRSHEKWKKKQRK